MFITVMDYNGNKRATINTDTISQIYNDGRTYPGNNGALVQVYTIYFGGNCFSKVNRDDYLRICHAIGIVPEL